jgi:hypothetical protein
LVPPPWTAGQAAWHSESVVQAPQVPPSDPLLLLPELEVLLPLSSSLPLLLVLLPELLLVLLPELLLVLLPELLLVLLPSWPPPPPSPKSNPLVESP